MVRGCARVKRMNKYAEKIKENLVAFAGRHYFLMAILIIIVLGWFLVRIGQILGLAAMLFIMVMWAVGLADENEW